MDPVSFVLVGVLTYIALIVFVGGLIYQVIKWMKTAKMPIRLGMYPQPDGNVGRGGKLVKDSFFFPQVLRVDKPIWFFAGAFHLAGVMMFVGHFRLIHEFTPLVGWLGETGMDQFAFFSGGAFGIVLTVALVYYLLRRFKTPFKDISVPEDYVLLILLLLIVTMGNHMRFFGDVHVEDYRAFVSSLLAFKPAFNDVIAASSMKWSLVTHVTLANVFFIYFPFSKLTHSIGTFAMNLIRSS
jgi:nitrate reductase gamma subunit